VTENCRTFLICGSGGVGKTTVSAALGVKFAMMGYKTLVLTIDPAKRLATSLGIEGLADIPQKIELHAHPEAGEMWAMMLDTKRTFDKIVEKYAPSKAQADRIYQNPVYSGMSQMLAGTQEYMAMEKLYEIHQTNAYDIIVLDTPPMQNALDFLSAPQRMSSLISNSFMSLLMKPAVFASKSGLKLVEFGTKPLVKIFDKIVGFSFLHDLSEMFILFTELLDGFHSRADNVRQMLTHPDCSFMAVCTTNEHSISEVNGFYNQLMDYQYHLEKIIVNRVYQGTCYSEEELEMLWDEMEEFCTENDSATIIQNYKKYIPLIKNDTAIINSLSDLVGNHNVSTIPLFLSDVHDLHSLQKVADSIKTEFEFIPPV